MTAFVFSNGLTYDFEVHAFRSTRQDDCITRPTATYAWCEPSEEDVMIVQCYFESVFPDAHERRALLQRLSKVLAGCSHEDKTMVVVYDKYTASGTGKSTLNNLLDMCCGQRWSRPPHDVFTKTFWRVFANACLVAACSAVAIDECASCVRWSDDVLKTFMGISSEPFRDLPFRFTPIVFVNQGGLPRFGRGAQDIIQRMEVFPCRAVFEEYQIWKVPNGLPHTSALPGETAPPCCVDGLTRGCPNWTHYAHYRKREHDAHSRERIKPCAMFRVLADVYRDLVQSHGGIVELPESCENARREMMMREGL